MPWLIYFCGELELLLDIPPIERYSFTRFQISLNLHVSFGLTMLVTSVITVTKTRLFKFIENFTTKK